MSGKGWEATLGKQRGSSMKSLDGFQVRAGLIFLRMTHAGDPGGEIMMKLLCHPAMAVSAAVAAIGSSGATAAAPNEPSLEEVRNATERFKDVKVALAEGYVRDPMNLCETAEMMGRAAALGAMGVHYFRPDLLGITAPPNPRVTGTGTHTDFRTPAVLIYEPQEDGSMQLVAVENLVFKRAWQAAGNKVPPAFHGVAYDEMTDDPATEVDEAHMFEPHYDRHVWVHRDNPNGVFAQFNPTVTCKHHKGEGHASH